MLVSRFQAEHPEERSMRASKEVAKDSGSAGMPSRRNWVDSHVYVRREAVHTECA
jgi:hypothetical protein